MRNNIIAAFAAVMMFTMSVFCSCGAGGGNVVGKWKCELYSSEQIIEFTSDGRFIDHTSYAENRYRVSGSEIVTYVEGEKGSEVAIPYKVNGTTLMLGETEYIRVTE